MPLHVYATGKNTFNRLLLGLKEPDHNGYTRITEFDKLPSQIVDIISSNTFAVALTKDNRIYLWGLDPNDDESEEDDLEAQKIRLLDTSNISSRILSVRVGYQHILVLDDEGSVYLYGQEGRSRTNNLRRLSFHKYKSITDAVEIRASAYFDLILNKKGQVYGLGDNSSNQLGSLLPPVERPTLIPGLAKYHVIQIAVANNAAFSLALTKCGKVLGWGDNSCSQIDSSNLSYIESPTEIKLLEQIPITRLLTGYFHACAVSRNNEIYTFGTNALYQQCGEPIGTMMNMMNLKSKVLQVSVGSDHTLVLSYPHEVVGWGYNENYQLGVKHKKTRKQFSSIDFFKNKRVIKVVASLGQSFVFVDEQPYPYGQLYKIASFKDIKIQ